MVVCPRLFDEEETLRRTVQSWKEADLISNASAIGSASRSVGRVEQTLSGSSPMKLLDLKNRIEAVGWNTNALECASALLEKINRLKSTNKYSALLGQLSSANEEGDFLGRVLEVNFADCFESKAINLQYGAKQGGNGDIDFMWQLDCLQIYIELKQLGQDRDTRNSIDTQLRASNNYAINLGDGLKDIVRLQRDLIQKASTKKFCSTLSSNKLNLVAIDVSALQLGGVDVDDCLLAAGGNAMVSQYGHELNARHELVGVFEDPTQMALNSQQCNWMKDVNAVAVGEPHPRSYIHGALFLFREPRDTRALSFNLQQVIVWNPALGTGGQKREICSSLKTVIPFKSKPMRPRTIGND